MTSREALLTRIARAWAGHPELPARTQETTRREESLCAPVSSHQSATGRDTESTSLKVMLSDPETISARSPETNSRNYHQRGTKRARRPGVTCDQIPASRVTRVARVAGIGNRSKHKDTARLGVMVLAYRYLTMLHWATKDSCAGFMLELTKMIMIGILGRVDCKEHFAPRAKLVSAMDP